MILSSFIEDVSNQICIYIVDISCFFPRNMSSHFYKFTFDQFAIEFEEKVTAWIENWIVIINCFFNSIGEKTCRIHRKLSLSFTKHPNNGHQRTMNSFFCNHFYHSFDCIALPKLGLSCRIVTGQTYPLGRLVFLKKPRYCLAGRSGFFYLL